MHKGGADGGDGGGREGGCAVVPEGGGLGGEGELEDPDAEALRGGGC